MSLEPCKFAAELCERRAKTEALGLLNLGGPFATLQPMWQTSSPALKSQTTHNRCQTRSIDHARKQEKLCPSQLAKSECDVVSIYSKQGSPYYHFDFQFRGRRYYGSTGCKGKRDAQEFERRERVKAALPDKRREEICIDDACGLYQEHAERLPSWKTIEYMLAAMVKGFGQNRLLSEISQRDLQLYFAKREIGRAPATVNREIENARSVWRYAERTRFEVGEPPEWKALRRKVARQTPRELSYEEEERLFAHLREDVKDAVSFLLKSGWRRAEVLGLRWADCALEKRQATTRIKGGDVVTRPLNDALMGLVTRQPKVGPFVFTYLCERSRDDRIKGQRYPLTPTALRKPFAQALADAKISDFRLHDLRHTRGTRIVRETGSIAAAKEALKHRSVSTTLRYAHVMDDDVRKALDASELRNSHEAKIIAPR